MKFYDALREMLDGFVIKVSQGDMTGFIYFNKNFDDFYYS